MKRFSSEGVIDNLTGHTDRQADKWTDMQQTERERDVRTVTGILSVDLVQVPHISDLQFSVENVTTKHKSLRWKFYGRNLTVKRHRKARHREQLSCIFSMIFYLQNNFISNCCSTETEAKIKITNKQNIGKSVFFLLLLKSKKIQ